MTPTDLEVCAIIRNIMAKVRIAYPFKRSEMDYAFKHLDAVKLFKDQLKLKTRSKLYWGS